MSCPCPPLGGIMTLKLALDVVPIPVLVRLARTPPDSEPGAPGKNCIDPWVYPSPPSVTNTSETFPKESTVIVAFPPDPSPRIGTLAKDVEIG